MNCPYCNVEETKVVDSRVVTGNKIRRRRECVACHIRFTTYESAELTLPWIVKRDGRRVPFDENKLRAGMERALEKRPVSAEAIDNIVHQITERLRALGEREVKSELLGEWVMEALRSLDEVAYVRFASVYRSFQDINAFGEVIKRLKDKTQEESSF